MCEYCGCQALAAIDELTREHDLVVNLIGHVRAAQATADVAGMAGLARRIAAILGPHTEVEEHGLFPALVADFPDHIAALQAEHRHIETVLGEAAAGTPGDPGWPGRLVETLELLREHILKEQDGVFPAALASLRTADWDAVDAVRSRNGTLLPAPGHRAADAADCGPPDSATNVAPDGTHVGAAVGPAGTGPQ